MSDNTFIKRKGTTDLGKDYEDYLAAYLTLQLLQTDEVKDFQISTNDSQFGNFDDLVVEVDYPNEQTERYALQLKHINNTQKNSKILRSEHLQKDKDFNILKYYKFFQERPILSEYKLILYTNTNSDLGSSTFSVNLENNESVELKIIECDPFLLINTPKKGKSFQFELDPKNSKEIKQKYKDFFERCFLYTNQMNVKKLQQGYIEGSFKTLTSRSFVTDKFLTFISTWSQIEGRKSKLTKDMMIKVITLYIVEDLIHPHTSCDVNEEKKLFQKAMSHFNITAFNNKSLENVVKIWGDSKNILRGCNIQEINQIRKQFQISTEYIQNIDDLTDEESTKLLWVLDKCPLIIKDHPSAHQAVKLCGEKSRFVLITDDLNNVKMGPLTVFKTLCDLKIHQPTYNDILQNFTFTLFGKKIHLEDLIKEDRVFEDLLTTDHFAKMTDNLDLIKLKEEELCFPYVERHLNKIIIDFTYLLNLDKSTMVLISNVTDTKKLRVKFQNFQIVSLNEAIGSGVPSEQMNLIVNTTETSREQFNMLKKKNEKDQKCHHFRWHEKCLEWIESIGDVTDLQKFFIKNYNFVENKKFYAENIRSNLKIIVGDPGMGKSVFVKNVKNNLLSKYFTVLIQPIDIPGLCRFIRDSGDLQKFFSFILQTKFSNFENFARQVLKMLMEKGRAVYLWDALDELSEENRNTVKELIVTLSKNSVAQFLTTRGFLRKELEDEFNVFTQELGPFNDEQQRNYIQKRLENICSDKELESTTAAIIKNIADISYREILGIPLQIYMLTELFCQDLEKYKKLFTELFDITDLYSHFIEEKFNDYFKNKKGFPENFNEVEFMKSAINDHIKKYQQIAVTSLFGKHIITETKTNSNEFIEKIKNRGDEFGLITTVDINMQPEFLHNSYAEYFAATYIAENCQTIPNLENFIFERKYANVRYFFDTLLAKKCPVHIAVLCKNLRYLQHCQDKNELKKKDMHGRNALHLAASWSERYPLLETWQDCDSIYIDDNIDFETKKENSDYHKIIKRLLTNCNFYGEKDQLFHLTPTMYAEKSECLFAAALIEKKQKNGNYLKTKNQVFVYSLLYYGIKYGFHDIVDLFANIKFTLIKNRSSLLHMAVENNQLQYLSKLLEWEVYKRNINYKEMVGETTPLMIASSNGYMKIMKYLIEKQADVNAADIHGTTSLHEASRKGHLKIVKYLIEKQADVNAANKYGETSLHFASRNGRLEIVKYLIEKQADVNAADKYNTTSLHLASENGHLEIVKYLIEKQADVNAANKYGKISLHFASRNGHLKIVKYLIEKQADVNAANKYGKTSLHFASRNGHLKIVKYLIEKQADVNAANKYGKTSLHFASRNGHLEIVKYLIEKQADVNAADKYNTTSLHLASENGHLEIVKYLIEKQADVNAADKYNTTSLHLASENGHLEIVKYLIKKQADVNATDRYGETSLHLAYKNGHLEIMKYLIEKQADVNATDRYGETSLHYASRNGHLEIVKYLIEKQADVNAADKYYTTSLDLASENGHLKIVKYLIEKQITDGNKYGRTSLHLASENEHVEIVKYLIEKRAEINAAIPINGKTALHYASEYGRLDELVKYLFEKQADVNAANVDGKTSLDLASRNRHLEIVNYLIKKQAIINAVHKYGRITLDLAEQNRKIEIAKYLKPNGALLTILFIVFVEWFIIIVLLIV